MVIIGDIIWLIGSAHDPPSGDFAHCSLTRVPNPV